MIGHRQLRKLFYQHLIEKGHKEIPAIPLVPKDDPTTLFTGSGMQQLVPYLLGEKHPQGNKLFNIQPCFRSQDIEEIGDNRHTTFFEMMGNWSLGNYFKKEQLAWFWEFLIEKIKLPQEKLYVTVFKGIDQIPADDESYQTWLKLGVVKDKIFRYEDNWWSRAGSPNQMPAGEPGGPDSEIFYDFGAELKIHENSKFKDEACHPNCDCGRFLEIANSVFMEYKKAPSGDFLELPKKNVDFGGGLERILAAINNDPDVFKTDLHQPIIQAFESDLNIVYDSEESKTILRIISDHSKASALLIKNGVLPSNKEQGYFLRRLIRRMVMKARTITGKLITADHFEKAIDGVLDIYEGIYLDKKTDGKFIKSVVNEEINRFSKTLEKGLREINKINKIDGKIAFDFYQSYGFPVEITEEIFLEKGQKINKQEFIKEFEKHKTISRASSIGKFKGGLADQSQQTLKYHTTTHLLHQALFEVLGREIHQTGSNITGERLRFDFYSLKLPYPETIDKVEDIINEKINEALPVTYKILPKNEALKLGAKSFFREKYPDMVKVYFIADFSKEFCGGPHVTNTSEIGKITIYKFEKIGSNLYRIYAK